VTKTHNRNSVSQTEAAVLFWKSDILVALWRPHTSTVNNVTQQQELSTRVFHRSNGYISIT